MNQLTKYLLAGLLVLSLSALSYGLWKRSEVTRLQAYTLTLENRVAGLESSQRAISESMLTLEREKRAADERARKATKELSDALKDSPDWAAAPVPARPVSIQPTRGLSLSSIQSTYPAFPGPFHTSFVRIRLSVSLYVGDRIRFPFIIKDLRGRMSGIFRACS